MREPSGQKCPYQTHDASCPSFPNEERPAYLVDAAAHGVEISAYSHAANSSLKWVDPDGLQLTCVWDESMGQQQARTGNNRNLQMTHSANRLVRGGIAMLSSASAHGSKFTVNTRRQFQLCALLLLCAHTVSAYPVSGVEIELIRAGAKELVVIAIPRKADIKWYGEGDNTGNVTGQIINVSSGLCVGGVAATGSWSKKDWQRQPKRFHRILLGGGAREMYMVSPMKQGSERCRWLPTAEFSMTMSYPHDSQRTIAGSSIVTELHASAEFEHVSLRAFVVWIDGKRWLALSNRSSVAVVLSSPFGEPLEATRPPEVALALKSGQVALYYSEDAFWSCEEVKEIPVMLFHDDGSYRPLRLEFLTADAALLEELKVNGLNAQAAGSFSPRCRVQEIR
jgi:hypothetical protein